MNRQTEITAYITKILQSKASPMTMKEIVKAAEAQFPGVRHAYFWNSVHNGCISPREKPRFVKTRVNNVNYFGWNF